MSLTAEVPPHKCAFLAEEALRLCSLPGEDQGRVYYFQRLRVTGLPEDGDRRAWLSAFQSAMGKQASEAVHGSDPHAAAAEAVYFRSEQEACESLLLLIATRNMPLAWHWRHVSGVKRILSAPAEIICVFEKLLRSPAAWTAVAAALFSIARQGDVVALLKLLPEETIEHWLRTIGQGESAYAAPVRFSASVVAVVARAIETFGVEAPVVLWLTTLAVIAAKPSSAENRSAVRIARSSLQTVIADISHLHRFRKDLTEKRDAEANAIRNPATTDAPAVTAIAAEPKLDQFLFGEPTSGAGLYFLLNALRQLQIDTQAFSLLFVVRLFRSIAKHAGIEPADPILRCCQIMEEQNEPETIDERLVRVWRIRIRRWCWRHGRIGVNEIVRRSGFVTLTRTDLDVTLVIESADIRIRRIGLDLDPGWLPWFGRVVRFHYRHRGELHG